MAFGSRVFFEAGELTGATLNSDLASKLRISNIAHAIILAVRATACAAVTFEWAASAAASRAQRGEGAAQRVRNGFVG
jgi:hypothetical protein